MTQTTRAVVVAALHKAIGLLDDPFHGPAVLAGKDLAFSSLDIDSLSLFEVLMSIEDSLGLELDSDEVASQPGLEALIALVDAKRAARVCGG